MTAAGLSNSRCCMERFTHSIRVALRNQNWYAALALSLTMPDICGRLEDPTIGSQRRYIRWWDEYMLASYQVKGSDGEEPRTFLSGSDAYALRCAYLHEGGDDIAEQRAQKAVERFHFITPPPQGIVVHMNSVDKKLQLQIDILCAEMCSGVDLWYKKNSNKNDVQQRMLSLITVHESSRGIIF
jgi:hypothetical protein